MRKIIYSISFIIFLLIVYCSPIEAATLKISKSKLELQYGKTYTLKANQKVSWSSSNKKIAIVSSNGKITAVGCGKVNIVAKNKYGKKKTCKVTVHNYTVKSTGDKRFPNKITVYTGNSSKTYTIYNQKGYSDSWVKNRGCSACSVAIVASAYGKIFTPLDIHYGDANKNYSERYSANKTGTKYHSNKSLTMYAVSTILKNSGVENRVVFKYKKTTAIKEITNNLKAGKPVIIICHNKTIKGNRLASYIHYLVAVGIDGNGKAIVLNPAGGSVNKSHFTGSFKLTVTQLINRHMFSSTGNKTKQFYYKQTRNTGGYILVTK